MPDGPDFICIGTMKAGTGWLFDQLYGHPDFWMPPLKEIHYLHQPIPKLGNSLKFYERNRQQLVHDKGGRRRPLEQRDIAFLEELTGLAGHPRNYDAYAALFRHKGAKLSGDVSPTYCVMEGADIAALAKRFPDTKIIFMVRDPVARTWSHICMNHRVGRFNERLLDNPKRFRKFLLKPILLNRLSYATRIVEQWRTIAPGLAFRTFLFDDLVSRPEHLRRTILQYLGADEHKAGPRPPGENFKAQKRKLEISPEIRDLIVEGLAGELRACADAFGGAAKSWAAQYGV